MTKYQYSIIRFVPSPIRGEFVNLGLIVGSDQTDEWLIDVVGSRSRATKLDDENVFPMVAADLQRLQSNIESYSDPDMFGASVDLSLSWLRELSRDSQNLLQFSTPKTVLATSAQEAMEKLWNRLVSEPTKNSRTSVTKSIVLSRYWAALKMHKFSAKNVKKKVFLETSKTHSPIDVVVHNGKVKDITQCWSLQIKNTDSLMNDIRSWGWTMRTLREKGGSIITNDGKIPVPHDVRIAVVYAPSENNQVEEEAFEVFRNSDVNARCVLMSDVDEYAKSSAADLFPPDLD